MTMDTLFLSLLVLLSLTALFMIFWVHLRSREQSERQAQELARQIIEAQKQDNSAQFLQREIHTLRDQLGKNMTDSAKLIMESQKTVGERLDRAAHAVGSVNKALGALDEATKQVFHVGKDISQLQEILRAPKMRGSIGELFLGDLLAQILPPKHFSLQYAFKTGEVVDAIVKLGRLVPIDSKFPLENFRKLIQNQDAQEKTVARRKFMTDVKRHIDAIANKYIRPDEGTFDFALMYIPAENVFYEIIVKDDATQEDSSLMTYAFGKRVIPVSPNSFYAYLHTISLGLRGLEIEENARLIIDQLSRLRNDFGRFKEDFTLLGKHLNNTRTKYEDSEKRLTRFEDKLITTGEKEDGKTLPSSTPSSETLSLK